MSIITLTTDLGLNDHYLGAVKGKIYSIHPEATIIDITHNIPSFDTMEAAFALKNSFIHFPKGSIHIIGVNPDIDENSEFLAAYYKEHYFIGTNNGTFSLIFDHQPDKIFKLEIKPDNNHESFPFGDVLIKAACHIAKGGTLEFIGKTIDGIEEKVGFRAASQGNMIRGVVMHIDRYGNALTNIDEDYFRSFGRDRSFSIITSSGYTINQISSYYTEVPQGEKLALFSSSKLLEIAINLGNASQLLGLYARSTVIVEFYDH